MIFETYEEARKEQLDEAMMPVCGGFKLMPWDQYRREISDTASALYGGGWREDTTPDELIEEYQPEHDPENIAVREWAESIVEALKREAEKAELYRRD